MWYDKFDVTVLYYIVHWIFTEREQCVICLLLVHYLRITFVSWHNARRGASLREMEWGDRRDKEGESQKEGQEITLDDRRRTFFSRVQFRPLRTQRKVARVDSLSFRRFSRNLAHILLGDILRRKTVSIPFPSRARKRAITCDTQFSTSFFLLYYTRFDAFSF